MQDPPIRLLVDFFVAKGAEELKREDRDEVWYQDWIDYQASHGLYAGLLSPAKYSTRGHHFDLIRLTRFLEVITYLSPAHAYGLHVSFLGLFPILMGSNEALKVEAIANLEAGGLLAFGVSERQHGADLLANEFVVRESAGCKLANGEKCYIGNANSAAMISILAREHDGESETVRKRAPFLFFVLRPGQSPGFRALRKIRTHGIRSAFVGEFEVHDHPVADSDVFSRQREAWSAMFGTIDFGKFFLGFGAVGICERAFAEAIAHIRTHVLYGKPVWKMSHLRDATAIAFGRMVAMKLYAFRALDYLQAANADDRRYLLFNPVQKARVSTEGVKVLALLSECIGARGFEADMYFETALRDASMIPHLEGSTHINFGLTAEFIGAYFTDLGADAPEPPASVSMEDTSAENPYWTAARDRNPRTVRFATFLSAYGPLSKLQNVGVFVDQINAFAKFAEGGLPALGTAADPRRLIGVGKCFSIIAYGQLVAESATAIGLEASIVTAIFHGLIEDLTSQAEKLAVLFGEAEQQRLCLESVIRIPKTNDAEWAAVADWLENRYGNSSSI